MGPKKGIPMDPVFPPYWSDGSHRPSGSEIGDPRRKSNHDDVHACRTATWRVEKAFVWKRRSDGSARVDASTSSRGESCEP